MENVLTVVFNVESEGFQAFTEIEESLPKRLFFVPQMSLVKYQEGSLKTLDNYESPELEDGHTFSGGLLGSLIGIIGGPIGMLLCGTTGAAIGYLSGSAKSEALDSLLENVIQKLEDGSVAIVALVTEEDEEVLNNMMSKFSCQIIRRSAAFVAEEVAEVKRMEEEMRDQLHARLRAEKKEQIAASIQQKRDKIKADFEAFKAKFKD